MPWQAIQKLDRAGATAGDGAASRCFCAAAAMALSRRGLWTSCLARGLSIDAIGAAGAGVANAVALAYGLALGGRPAAQRSLRALWRHVGSRTRSSTRTFRRRRRPAMEARSPASSTSTGCAATRRCRFFIAATNARSGALRLFAGREITHDAVLAAMSPEAAARAIGGDHYCAAGVHEEFAALPLLGEHDGVGDHRAVPEPAARAPCATADYRGRGEASRMLEAGNAPRQPAFCPSRRGLGARPRLGPELARAQAYRPRRHAGRTADDRVRLAA